MTADTTDILERATARPWHCEGHEVVNPTRRAVIAQCFDDRLGDAAINAALIVAAVNSFEANRALIAELVEFVKNYSKGEKTMAQCDADAREILAKTEGL